MNTGNDSWTSTYSLHLKCDTNTAAGTADRSENKVWSTWVDWTVGLVNKAEQITQLSQTVQMNTHFSWVFKHTHTHTHLIFLLIPSDKLYSSPKSVRRSSLPQFARVTDTSSEDTWGVCLRRLQPPLEFWKIMEFLGKHPQTDNMGMWSSSYCTGATQTATQKGCSLFI